MKTRIKRITIIMTMMAVMGGMMLCLGGCGEGGSDEETVEITTVEEEKTEKADISEYESIYNDCNEEMSEATRKYAEELNSKVDELSTDDLYDLVQEKTDALKEIKEKYADKMTDKTLSSTEDDQKEYEKWFSAMNEAYTDYTRELTSIYTDQF